MTQQENCSNLDILSIQKITWFVNDCVTFRQKTTFYATSSGLFSTRALVRPSGRISPAAVSAILVSVGPASSYTSTENSTTILSAQTKSNRNTAFWQRFLPRGKKKLLPSSLRDATHSPSGTFVPPPPAGGVFLTEGGSGEKEKCSILPKAPSLRELARRKT